MNVNLTVELERLVQHKVQSGRYNSASEVVREALRLMEQKDELRGHQLQALRDRMDLGLVQARLDGFASGEKFMATLAGGLDRPRRKLKRKLA